MQDEIMESELSIKIYDEYHALTISEKYSSIVIEDIQRNSMISIKLSDNNINQINRFTNILIASRCKMKN